VDLSIRGFYLDNLSVKVERLLLDPPVLVSLDINMSKEDGFTWLKKLRNRDYTLPIVIYFTTRNSEK
jgi:DNA-binding response OmpR family regulator